MLAVKVFSWIMMQLMAIDDENAAQEVLEM
jgi:hypothetical protein